MSQKRNQRLDFSISQNFLTSQRTIERLLRLTDINESDTVIEIGAGKGHITRALSKRGCKLIASEIDRKLFLALKDKLADCANLTLSNTDFLKTHLPRKGYKVFSNIPFSITTDIVRKLTQAANPPTDAWLVMEKGAAKRFCGRPNETLQSLLLKPFFDLRVVYHFRREDFHPAPRVDIVLLHISKKQVPDIQLSKKTCYNEFISQSLGSAHAPLSHRQIAAILRQAGLPPKDGVISYVQWLCLFRQYFRS